MQVVLGNLGRVYPSTIAVEPTECQAVVQSFGGQKQGKDFQGYIYFRLF